MCWCWCWWCCVLIVCLYLKWYFYLGLSQLPARRPAKNYQAHKNKCARATGHQPAPGAGGGYITVCSSHLLQQQQHSSQGLRACTCSITITLTIVLWLGYVYGNRDLMCGCSSASHVSCIPQQSRPGWGPLSHSNGCNLIHNQGFTHIIAITSLASHCSQMSDVWSSLASIGTWCCHTASLSTLLQGEGGNIQNHAFVPTWHLNDCWSWSLLECRALHCHWGGQLPGGENWIFWAHPEQLLHHCTALPVPVEQTPQLTDICR